ncbi:MAG: SDR family oxidoreductase [Variovorax sp.]
MKVVVIGGSGLIGSRIVANLRQRGHEAVAASPSTGVDTLTGAGLAQALAGAEVVIDVANSPSFEDEAAMNFFETSGRNLFAAEKAAGVRHHVALSVVGTERLLASGYFRAKLAQERLIAASGIPWTLVRATQFFEFLGAIAQTATEGDTVRLPRAHFQPMAADDVARLVTDAALAEPPNAMLEIAGPDRVGLAEQVRRFLAETGDGRTVVTDPQAQYFGLDVNDASLTPASGARLGSIGFDAWIAAQAKQPA